MNQLTTSLVPTFDTWAATKVTKSLLLSSLQGSVVGIDATYYLENTAKEPLVSALGGFPLALESSVVRELKDLQSIGLRLHFVFSALDHGLDDDPFGPSLAAANNNALAFETYENYQPVQAIQVFRNSGIHFNPQSCIHGNECIRSAHSASAGRVPEENLT